MSEEIKNIEAQVPVAPTSQDKVSKLKEAFMTRKDQARTWIKKNPVVSGVIAVVMLSAGSYIYMKPSNEGSSMLMATTSGNINNKLNITQNIQEGSFLILSAAKKNDKLFLNNAKDYKQASQIVVVDLKACPNLAQLNPQALIGQNLKFKGNFATYDGKPQVIVSNANDISIGNIK